MQKLLAWLQLCRFAAVFTAMADICLGYLLTHEAFEPARDFGLLLASSSCLYLAGMVFNDVFDREIDSRERPKRPIPSGRVSLRGAVAFGAILVGIGLLCSLIAGTGSAIIAGLLTACIFLYDGAVKSTVAGPVAMGACRFLNVMLGASLSPLPATAGAAWTSVWALPQLHVAAGLGIYIAGVTWFARHEAGTSRPTQLAAAAGTINLGIAILVGFVLNWPEAADRRVRAALALGLVAVIVNRRLLAALLDPVPAKVQAAVRAMLLSLIMLDAVIVFSVRENNTCAIAVALLLVPATLLSRFLAVT